MERGIDDRVMPPGGEVSGTDRAVSPVADVAMTESAPAPDVEELLPHSPAELRQALADVRARLATLMGAGAVSMEVQAGSRAPANKVQAYRSRVQVSATVTHEGRPSTASASPVVELLGWRSFDLAALQGVDATVNAASDERLLAGLRRVLVAQARQALLRVGGTTRVGIRVVGEEQGSPDYVGPRPDVMVTMGGQTFGLCRGDCAAR
jgi:hypothetical protein